MASSSPPTGSAQHDIDAQQLAILDVVGPTGTAGRWARLRLAWQHWRDAEQAQGRRGSQAALANQIGIPDNRISVAIQPNEHGNSLGQDYLTDLATALGVPEPWLLEGACQHGMPTWLPALATDALAMRQAVLVATIGHWAAGGAVPEAILTQAPILVPGPGTGTALALDTPADRWSELLANYFRMSWSPTWNPYLTHLRHTLVRLKLSDDAYLATCPDDIRSAWDAAISMARSRLLSTEARFGTIGEDPARQVAQRLSALNPSTPQSPT